MISRCVLKRYTWQKTWQCVIVYQEYDGDVFVCVRKINRVYKRCTSMSIKNLMAVCLSVYKRCLSMSLILPSKKVIA